jgi:hypothetical protein
MHMAYCFSCHPAHILSFTGEPTTDPALIPQDIAGSSRPSPRIPARPGSKGPLTAGIPAALRSARNRQDRPVTPEVAIRFRRSR